MSRKITDKFIWNLSNGCSVWVTNIQVEDAKKVYSFLVKEYRSAIIKGNKYLPKFSCAKIARNADIDRRSIVYLITLMSLKQNPVVRIAANQYKGSKGMHRYVNHVHLVNVPKVK